MILYFAEVEGEPTCLNRSLFGAIYFMHDGNIGKADITIGNTKVQLRLAGINLIVRRVDKLINNKFCNIYTYS